MVLQLSLAPQGHRHSILRVSRVKQLHRLSFDKACASESGGCISEGRWWGQGRVSGLLGGLAEQRWSFESWGWEQDWPGWLQRASSPGREGGFSPLHATTCRMITLDQSTLVGVVCDLWPWLQWDEVAAGGVRVERPASPIHGGQPWLYPCPQPPHPTAFPGMLYWDTHHYFPSTSPFLVEAERGPG